MKYTLIVGVLAVMLTACASFRPYAPTIGGTLAGAACIPAGPEAAVLCGTVASGATEAIIGDAPRALSSDPEIAKKQIEAEEREFIYGIVERWGIYAMVLFALIFWILPDPMKIFDRFRRKIDEVRIQQ